ncbi:hypothetical protein NUSPORA_02654 [Nucleospora cyclopteri]
MAKKTVQFDQLLREITEADFSSSDEEFDEGIICESSMEVQEIRVNGKAEEKNEIKYETNKIYTFQGGTIKEFDLPLQDEGNKKVKYYTEEELKNLEIKSKKDNSRIIKPIKKKKIGKCLNFDE